MIDSLKSGGHPELNTERKRDGKRGTEREKDRAAGWRANDLGFRQKCQMSQRHSGKTLLFNMAPQSATEAANLQCRNNKHLQQPSEGSARSQEKH